jgi:hypothetical protein
MFHLSVKISMNIYFNLKASNFLFHQIIFLLFQKILYILVCGAKCASLEIESKNALKIGSFCHQRINIGISKISHNKFKTSALKLIVFFNKSLFIILFNSDVILVLINVLLKKIIFSSLYQFAFNIIFSIEPAFAFGLNHLSS